MAAVRALPGYKEENPVTKGNYKSLIGWYDLPSIQTEERCCYQEDTGNLCHEGHRHGFVALLNDGSISIIGNSCARTKFGAEHQLRLDVNRLVNERNRQEKLNELTQELRLESERLKKCSDAAKKLRELRVYLKTFEQTIGATIFSTLKTMARLGNGTVKVSAKHLEEVITFGIKKTKSSFTQHVVGTFGGIQTFAPDGIHDIGARIMLADKKFASARELKESDKATDFSKAASSLRDLDVAVAQAVELLEAAETFFQNDLQLLSLLTDNKDEKWTAMQFAFEKRGGAIGKEKAKELVAQQAELFRKQFNAHEIVTAH